MSVPDGVRTALDEYFSRRMLIGALAMGSMMKVLENIVRGDLPLAARFLLAAAGMVLLYLVWPALETAVTNWRRSDD